MPTDISDFDSAMRMRDVIRRIVNEEVLAVYPRPRYATVLSSNTSTGRVLLRFPDETTSFELPATVIMPAGSGGVVRVGGPANGRYVDEVVGGSLRLNANVDMDELTATEVTTPTAIVNNLQVTSSGTHAYIIVDRQNTTTEGGEIRLNGPDNTNHVFIDNVRSGGVTSARIMPGATGLVITTSNVAIADSAQMGLWSLNGAYARWGHAGAPAGSYAMIQDAAGDTFIGSAASRTVFLRPNANTATFEVSVTSGGTHTINHDWIVFNRPSIGTTRVQANNSGLIVNPALTTYAHSVRVGEFFSRPGIWFSSGDGAVASAGNELHFTTNTRNHTEDQGLYILDRTTVARASTTNYGTVLIAESPLTLTGAARNWGTIQVRSESYTSAGTTPSAGYVAHVNNVTQGFAVLWTIFHSLGEVWQAVNSANSAYCPIYASAFTVQSTIRIKSDVLELEDGQLLTDVAKLYGKTWLPKAKPRSLRQTPKFKDVNDRWVARGHTPLRPKDYHLDSLEHDCAVDGCDGTAENPCPITLNYTRRYGLIAEEMYELFPEVVDVDENGKPNAIAIDQVASLALAAVAALTRRLQKVESTLAAGG